ncbi:MAG: HlyD family efflux transporter periplasmic adaptor subunit [Oceanospirillales bacterium]|nr:HlyD family efflux transporter periplasmic adaptor subunit [Oceanospirillales bacterium]MBR9887139.1 HlyD family efflux transporter periplasmic adaptor subunit [Oceanospirillales bacterium]
MLDQPTEQQFLPSLRQNLKLIKGGVDEEGARRWLIFDPTINKYFSLSRVGLDLMRIWQPGQSYEDFLTRAQVTHPFLEIDEIKAFVDFLDLNGLIVRTSDQDIEKLKYQNSRRKQGWFKWLIHNYLFFRIPVVKPDGFLNATYPKIKWLYQSWVSWILIIVGVIGILLTVRQWDTFTHSFSYFYSWQGLLFYFAGLSVVKILHELGHAYTARRNGCRVGSIGLAFIVMFPVLYTDTTDAWKLSSKYQKLAIATAGIKVELCLALIATFIWAIVPDGIFRSVAFVIASTTWISSLLVNVSPFLRFDGYYAFSDWLGCENLQSRSFAFGRWYLRKLIFGIDLPAPEPLSLDRRKIFIIYAWFTWIYRFFLFMGIALLVYHFAFKVLGIILFLVEILWFIILPIAREIKAWGQMKDIIHLNKHTFIALLLLFSVILLAAIPWQTSISIDAVFKYKRHTLVYAPEPARVSRVYVSSSDEVKKGDPVADLISEDLEYKMLSGQIELGKIQAKLDRVMAVNVDKQQREVLEFSLQRAKQYLAGLTLRADALRVVSPINGTVSNMSALSISEYVSSSEPLVSLVDYGEYEVLAYLPEEQLQALQVGASARFIANNGQMLNGELTVREIKQLGSQQLEYPELASVFGGHVPVRGNEARELIVEGAFYEVLLEPTEVLEQRFDIRTPGKVVIQGVPKSWAAIFFNHLMAVVIREINF